MIAPYPHSPGRGCSPRAPEGPAAGEDAPRAARVIAPRPEGSRGARPDGR